MQNKWIQARLNNRWGEPWWVCNYFFGSGYTIFTRNLFSLGREIHVNSSVPLRHITREIMNSFDCDWWTTIEPSNKKAHNLAIKSGFSIIKSCEIKDISNDNLIKLNIYKRCRHV